MFEKLYVIVGKNEADIYRMMKIATFHSLRTTYKIGVYGTDRQHELFIITTPWRYRKFMKAISLPANKDKL